jgi:hypothetical protein
MTLGLLRSLATVSSGCKLLGASCSSISLEPGAQATAWGYQLWSDPSIADDTVHGRKWHSFHL